MLTKIVLLFIGFGLGYFTCCLMTASEMASLREEANEYIEYMKKTFEERYDKND